MTADIDPWSSFAPWVPEIEVQHLLVLDPEMEAPELVAAQAALCEVDRIDLAVLVRMRDRHCVTGATISGPKDRQLMLRAFVIAHQVHDRTAHVTDESGIICNVCALCDYCGLQSYACREAPRGCCPDCSNPDHRERRSPGV